jgi:hypothetical protein
MLTEPAMCGPAPVKLKKLVRPVQRRRVDMQSHLHEGVNPRLSSVGSSNKRLILAGAMLLVFVIIAGSSLPFLLPSAPSPPCFSEQLAEKIREGMTEAEVVAVLGRPPGWYASPDTSYIGSGPMGYWVCPEGWHLPDGDVHKGWISDAGAVCVRFGKDGKVVGSHWAPVYAPGAESTEAFPRRMMRRLLR